MATISPEHFGALGHERRSRFVRALAAESTSEALAGAAALVLAIIGLAGMASMYMMTIGVIALGVAFLFDGAVALTRAWNGAGAGTETMAAGAADNQLSAEVLGGAAGVVLGVLALIGIVPQILCSCAILVFGACMLVATGGEGSTRRWHTAPGDEMKMVQADAESTFSESGTRPLVALAAIVLGLLAIVNIASTLLTLIGVLVLGASFVINGPAMTTRRSSGVGWTH
jgi:hypothetical protein